MELREASGKEENCHKKELKFHERSMKTYILKKDLPWAKAGSEWSDKEDSGRIGSIALYSPSGLAYLFPSETFSDWFEEKKPEVTFSEEQKNALMLRIYQMTEDHDDVPSAYETLKQWIKEHTV